MCYWRDELKKSLQVGSDPSSNIFDDAEKLNGAIFFLSTESALISGTGRIESHARGDCLTKKKHEVFSNLYEEMKNLNAECLPRGVF